MPSYSLLPNIMAEYEIIEGKPRISIRSESALKYRGFYICTVRLTFMRNKNSKVYGVEPIVPRGTQPVQAQVDDKTGIDGKSHVYTVWMDSLSPSTGFFDQNMWGAFSVPAVHIDIAWDRDIWVFLMRSPWFPVKVSLPTNTLSITHDSAHAAVIATASAEGGISAVLTNSGSGYKRVSLVVRRAIGGVLSMIADETIGEATSGMQPCTWKTVTRDFDLLLVTGHTMSLTDFASVLGGLGASVSASGTGLSSYFVLADGPGVAYMLVLDGDRGLLRHDVDGLAFQLSW